MKHKLLILITTYARGYNLPAIVKSIVRQTFKDYKIVICDDCSPNDPTEIIKYIKKKYPEVDIEYYRNKTNVSEGRNINLNMARQFDNDFEYLVLLQEDTIYLEDNFLNYGITLLEQNPDVTYFYGLPDESGHAPRDIVSADNAEISKISGVDLWRIWGIPIHWAACIFRYDKVFEYRFSGTPRRDCLQNDSLMLLRFALRGNVIMYNKLMMNVTFNKVGGGYYESFENPIKRFVSEERYLRFAAEYAIECGVTKEESDNWYVRNIASIGIRTIKQIGQNAELLEKFMTALIDYDIRISVTILNLIIKMQR